MRIPGLKTVRRSARWLESLVRHGALVLGYHRVADPPSDLFHQCVSPKHFVEHIEVITQLATPLPLAELVARVHKGTLPRRAVAVTFDDAYADLTEQAVPFLRKRGVPATVFAVSGLLGKEFWWDRLEQTLPLPPEVESCGGAALHSLYWGFREMPPDEREQVLASRPRTRSSALAMPRSMTADELRQLAAVDAIDVGAHTRTHPWLPSLAAADRECEIAQSRRDLQEILGRPIAGFAYPYGGESAALGEEVRRAGYDFGCGSRNGVLFGGDNLFTIPRWWVPNQNGEALAKWLRRWLHA
jgi:peptidoglycan/xylan/chitin deacetylase (PgdA/CDA1 family)